MRCLEITFHEYKQDIYSQKLKFEEIYSFVYWLLQSL